MKRLFLLLGMSVATLAINAQNIQVHYDFGRSLYTDEEDGRQNFTDTFEQFSADKLGSWYSFFVNPTIGVKFKL